MAFCGPTIRTSVSTDTVTGVSMAQGTTGKWTGRRILRGIAITILVLAVLYVLFVIAYTPTGAESTG